MTTPDPRRVTTFRPGWLKRRVATSVALLDSLPPKLRASLEMPSRRRPTVTDERPTARSVRDLEPPDVRDRLDAIDQEATDRAGDAALTRARKRVRDDGAGPVDVTDEMVDAFIRASMLARLPQLIEEELDSHVARCKATGVWEDNRAGLAAVVPLIRAQREADVRAAIAFEIRAELVCCDIYERLSKERDERRWRTEQTKGHDLCYWGEAAARIAESHELRTLSGEHAEFNAQVAHALRQLDGSTASAVALLTGMSRDEIDQFGGVTSDGGDDRG